MVEKLFTPVTVGQLTLPHRIVLSPMTRCRASDDQVPKKFVADYYVQRASSHGFLITDATSIHRLAAPIQGTPGIYSAEQIEAWKHVVDRVHEAGGKIFMQLWHIGRAGHSSLLDGQPPVCSSAIKIGIPTVKGQYVDGFLGGAENQMPRPLEEGEVEVIVGQFITAAKNAVLRAGFDGVELDGANGYLIDQFLRDGVNKRTDKYGGTIEKRCKFLLDIMEGIGSEIGPSKLGVRLTPFGTFNSMSDSDPVALFTHLFQALNQKLPELAYIHLTDYTNGSKSLPATADQVFQLRKVWNGTCILNLSRLSRENAIQIVEENKADMVSLGRDFLANPDLPLRYAQNLPLNPQDVNTFYTREEAGYIDYPFYKGADV